MNGVEGQDKQLVSPAGTSFSAAIVSGVAALVRQKYPDPDLASSDQPADPVPPAHRRAGSTIRSGYGIVDPVAAMTYDLPDGDPRPPERIADRWCCHRHRPSGT